MEQIRMVAIDLAKNFFQIHGVDAAGQTCLQQRLRRSEVLSFFAGLSPLTVGMEACPGAHYWGRLLSDQGHDVRLVPPHYVKPFVQRQKNDAVDAAAIYEAMIRPTMRFVPVKTHDQQANQVALRTREVLVRQRTMSINALRGHLAEFGVIAGVGVRSLRSLIERLDDFAESIPEFVRGVVQMLIDQIADCTRRIDELTAMIGKRSAADAVGRRLMTIPGIGPLTAAAILAAAPDATRFNGGRHFAAWTGLVPKQHSTGGRSQLGRITKMGDRTIRRLLISGALTVIAQARKRPGFAQTWLGRLVLQRPTLVAAVALANKNARIVWALMAKGGVYRPAAAA